ncbi:MAG: DUF3137 domain-containing protein [Oscillospiraceae bacterium]|jgi:hypothetical protein|nr:DUF3137 domain-containing protein [Oscillospiraceae bacterium]
MGIFSTIKKKRTGFWNDMNAMRQKSEDQKIEIMSEALTEVFNDCEYRLKGTIKRETIRDADLIDGWSASNDRSDPKEGFSIVGNDYFNGKYKGREFEYCNAEIRKHWTEKETDENWNVTEREDWRQLFRGMWIICKLDKPVPAIVRVREKKGFLSSIGDSKRKKAKGDVEMENLAFNEQFEILTGDAHGAFRIITPHFMELILSADSKARSRTMLCFAGDKIHIALERSKSSFEFHSYASKDAAELKLLVLKDIKYLTDILDELFQNEYLFGRED